MKVIKNIDINVDVEIEINSDDIESIIAEEENSTAYILRTINNFARYMHAVPDDQISKMNGTQKTMIFNFLIEQSKRVDTNDTKGEI